MLSGFEYILAGFAALAAGAVNALAGGGTLITFPMLTFLGVPAVAANITNTVALCPGYFGGTLAQWNDLRGQRDRLWLIVPASIVGGVLGGFLLLQTGEKLFKELVPYLILLASGLLAIQDPIRKWLTRRLGTGQAGTGLEKLTWLPVGLASIYGGYFGAGNGILILAAMGLLGLHEIHRANGIKNFLGICINSIAVLSFALSHLVVWSDALMMAGAALIGGYFGAKMAVRIGQLAIRRAIVAIGFVITFAMLWRLWH